MQNFGAKTKINFEFSFGDGKGKKANKKIYIFCPCDFFKGKTLQHARPNLPIFWNWTHKNIPDWQHRARFQKSKKSSISLHPTREC